MELSGSIYDKKIQELYEIAPSFQNVGKTGYHPGLETMSDLEDFLQNPHRRFRSVHVAGTNGKGSVSHLLASMIAVSRPGLKVGLYTSPHLVDFRERIRIVVSDGNGCSFEEIGKSEVVSFLDRTDVFLKERRPSFFEITTAMAFDYFSRKQVDIAVIETGLGGRIDSTNVLLPELSVITSIGYDHLNILGSTLEEIAGEKGGIIKESVPVVTGNLPQTAFEVISGIAERKHAPLLRYSDCPPELFGRIGFDRMDLRSESQKINVRTALQAYSLLAKQGLVPETPVLESVLHAAANTGLRGRWERLSDVPTVLCDIGHNPEAMSISMRQLEKEAQKRTLYMILGMSGDKDAAAVSALLPLDAHYCFTRAKGMRAMPAEKLRDIVDADRKSRGVKEEYLDSRLTSSVQEAVETVLANASADDCIFIGGSSFVVAEAIPLFE